MATFDRRRTNPPQGDTAPPAYDASLLSGTDIVTPCRTREPNELRKIFLQTGLTPSASGSAYLELAPATSTSLTPYPHRRQSTLKLSATVHGPRPLPRTVPYSSTLQLTATVKFAPFASRTRRGYVRDNAERDLGAQLEAALRATILAARWPKSGAEVVITVLEGAEEWLGGSSGAGSDESTVRGALGEASFARMVVLAGCVTVAGAALAGAGIDSVDLPCGGVAALVRQEAATPESGGMPVLLDPDFAEHAAADVVAACCIAYLPARDEIAGLWTIGDIPLTAAAADAGDGGGSESPAWERLLDGAVRAAGMAGSVVRAAINA